MQAATRGWRVQCQRQWAERIGCGAQRGGGWVFVLSLSESGGAGGGKFLAVGDGVGGAAIQRGYYGDDTAGLL